MSKQKNLTETGIEQELLFDGTLLKLFRDRVKLPDDNESVREWIDHPGAAAVVPIFKDGSTLLLRQFRYPARKTFIEVPAGKFDTANEAPEDLAQRELKEETGWQARQLEHLGQFYPCIGYSNEIIHFFLAQDLKEGTKKVDDEEFVEPFRVSFEEALAMVQRGEIEDMKTVVALMLAEEALKED